MRKADYKKKQESYIAMLDEAIKKAIICKGNDHDRVKEAMLYSLTAGGKRIRGMLTIEFAKAYGAELDDAICFACAVEFIHCYSLIHDDLPCMDNDDLRRGKPSCHMQFDEATALLAGDGLLTLAFEMITKAKGVTPENALKAVSRLARYAGVDGMIAGQTLDLLYEGRRLVEKEILTIDKLKTSCLLQAAATIGCLAANNSNEDVLENAEQYTMQLGIAFQITDDVLDVIGSEKQLGKPIGSDIENEKCTYTSLFGVKGALEIAEKYTNQAFSYLEKLPDNEFLLMLTKSILTRTN